MPKPTSSRLHKGDPDGSLLAAPRVCACLVIPASTLQTVALLSGRVKYACHRNSPSSLLLAQGCGGNTSRSGVLLDDLGVLSLVGLLFLWKKQALSLVGSGERRSRKMHNMCTCSEFSFLKYLQHKTRVSSGSLNIQLSEFSPASFSHVFPGTFLGRGGAGWHKKASIFFFLPFFVSKT